MRRGHDIIVNGDYLDSRIAEIVGRIPGGEAWSPSTDWNDAMQAAERMELFDCVTQGDPPETWDSIPQCKLIRGGGGWWFVLRDGFPTSQQWCYVSAPTGPMAICLAIIAVAEHRKTFTEKT